jgi:hypothetical protein
MKGVFFLLAALAAIGSRSFRDYGDFPPQRVI